MPRYEYKIVPAPEKANKVKGMKGPARFAATLEEVMNEMGADGWHYLRADTLPQEERSGLTSKTTTYRNLLVFCRELPPVVQVAAPTPAPVAAPVDPEPESPDLDPDNEPSLANIFDTEPEPDTPAPSGTPRFSR